MARLEPSAVPLHQLIASPLLAAIQADAQIAEAHAGFIERIGFERGTRADDGRDMGALRMVQFDATLQGADGRVRARRQIVPALAVMPIPLLQIKDARFDFPFRIRSRMSRPPQSSRVAPGDDVNGELARYLSSSQLRFELKGTIGRAGTEGSPRSPDIQMRVTVRVERVPGDASTATG